MNAIPLSTIFTNILRFQFRCIRTAFLIHDIRIKVYITIVLGQRSELDLLILEYVGIPERLEM